MTIHAKTQKTEIAQSAANIIVTTKTAVEKLTTTAAKDTTSMHSTISIDSIATYSTSEEQGEFCTCEFYSRQQEVIMCVGGAF